MVALEAHCKFQFYSKKNSEDPDPGIISLISHSVALQNSVLDQVALQELIHSYAPQTQTAQLLLSNFEDTVRAILNGKHQVSNFFLFFSLQ